MSLQPVDVQRIFLRPVSVLPQPVRWFFKVSSSLPSGLPARSGKRGAYFAACRRDRLAAAYRTAAGRFILPDRLRLHLSRSRILLRDRWLDFGRTDVVSSGCACVADSGLTENSPDPRRFFLRGRSVVDRLTHNQQAAGSIPAPATSFMRSRPAGCVQPEEAKGLSGVSPADRAHILAAGCRQPGAAERQSAGAGKFFYADGELCRWASRAECARIFLVCSVASVLLCALVFYGCWHVAGGAQ